MGQTVLGRYMKERKWHFGLGNEEQKTDDI